MSDTPDNLWTLLIMTDVPGGIVQANFKSNDAADNAAHCLVEQILNPPSVPLALTDDYGKQAWVDPSRVVGFTIVDTAQDFEQHALRHILKNKADPGP